LFRLFLIERSTMIEEGIGFFSYRERTSPPLRSDDVAMPTENRAKTERFCVTSCAPLTRDGREHPSMFGAGAARFICGSGAFDNS
jgi:hypothetical protein